MRFTAIVVLTMIGGSGMLLSAQSEFLSPKGLSPTHGFSQVVVVAPGSKLVFLSGQVSENAEGQPLNKGDLKAQTEQAFQNIKTALSSAGSSFDHVIKITYYVKDYNPKFLAVLREVRSRYVSQTSPPASTLVGVASLFEQDYLIEVEAIAVVPEKRAK